MTETVCISVTRGQCGIYETCALPSVAIHFSSQLIVRRSKNILDADLLHASIVVGTSVEQAGVTFDRAFEHDVIVAVWVPSPALIALRKQGDAWSPDRGGEVLWARIDANEQIAAAQQRARFRERKFSREVCRQPSLRREVLAHQVVLGAADQNDGDAARDQIDRDGGEPFRRPQVAGSPGPWRDRDNWYR